MKWDETTRDRIMRRAKWQHRRNGREEENNRRRKTDKDKGRREK
jgi:hypothetical protein